MPNKRIFLEMSVGIAMCPNDHSNDGMDVIKKLDSKCNSFYDSRRIKMVEDTTAEFKAKWKEAFKTVAVDEDEQKAKADLLKPDPEDSTAALAEYGIKVDLDKERLA